MLFIDPYFGMPPGQPTNSPEEPPRGNGLSLQIRRRRKKRRSIVNSASVTNSVPNAAPKPFRPERTEAQRVAELREWCSVGTENLINAAIHDGRQLVDVLDDVIAAQQQWNSVLATAKQHGGPLSGGFFKG